MNFSSCIAKQKEIEDLFRDKTGEQERYEAIIALGKKLPKLPVELKTDENLVKGCQSRTYICSTFDGITMHIKGESDALISSGLLHLLLKAYDGEAPETILKCPPAFIEALNLAASLSPNRANGLYSMHLRLKQDALKFLIEAGIVE